MLLQTSYDLFKGKLNDNPAWIATSELLDEGIEELASLADSKPGDYFLYNSHTGLVVASLQKMAAKPAQIIHHWT